MLGGEYLTQRAKTQAKQLGEEVLFCIRQISLNCERYSSGVCVYVYVCVCVFVCACVCIDMCVSVCVSRVSIASLCRSLSLSLSLCFV